MGDLKLYIGMGIGILLGNILYEKYGKSTPEIPERTDYTTYKPQCRQFLADNYKIASSEELRTVICNDPQLYKNGFDRAKALDSYKTIVESLK